MPQYEIQTTVPMITQARIQAEMVVPIVKRLVEELGKERAYRLVRESLDDYRRTFVRTLFEQLPGERVQERCYAGWQFFLTDEGETDAATVNVVRRQDDEAFEFDVVGCRWAELFTELGEPEIGHLLFCSQDFVWCDAIDGVELTRTQTIMEGADHCDFRVRFVPIADAPRRDATS
jgi:L-2-amino-thiazoline-4-carboxylic acid hydrolase